MTTAARRRRERERLNFDWGPPACANCVHRRFDKVMQQHFCGTGKFQVMIHSICDAWEDVVTGDTLEAKNVTHDQVRTAATPTGIDGPRYDSRSDR